MFNTIILIVIVLVIISPLLAYSYHLADVADRHEITIKKMISYRKAYRRFDTGDIKGKADMLDTLIRDFGRDLKD